MLELIFENISWVILGIVGICILSMGMRIVRPVEKGLIERLGKFKRLATQGFHLIIPVVDRMIKVNVTENMVDVAPQKIITKDDLNATVDAVVYFRVTDPEKAMYQARDYVAQISSLAKTTLRDIIGRMTLTEANSKRNDLNEELEGELDKQTDAWGIDIIRVELQRIDPPDDVQEAMNKVVIAERDKKAAIDFATAEETKADGQKRASIKEAEGTKQAKILEADGEAEAIKKVASANAEKIKVIAEADAERIEKVNESIIEHFKDNAITYKKLETVQNSLQNNSKFVIDPTTEITNVISEQMAGVIPIKDKTSGKSHTVSKKNNHQKEIEKAPVRL